MRGAASAAPNRSAARRRYFATFAAVDATIVLLESAKRLAACLEDLHSVLGDREAAVARELTKLHEEVVRDRLSVLAERFAETGPPRGEVVLVIGPPHADAAPLDQDEIDARIAAGLKTDKPGTVASKLAGETGLPRRALYQRAVALKQGLAGEPER